jgi:general secretion pathway protein K
VNRIDEKANWDQQGMVLVILLWVLAIVSLVTLSFSKSIRVEFQAAHNNKDMVAAYYLAKAGMAESAYRLIRRQTAPQMQMTDGMIREPDDLDRGLVTSEFPEGRVTTRIIDESGKISINSANEEMLRRLMAALGIEKATADTIVDSIFDWTDPDNNHRLSGAEDDYYQKLSPPYRAKNGPFETIEELLLVQGVTPDIFYGIRERDEMGQVIERYGLINCLTVYSMSSQINLNAAPLPVLLAIPDMEPNAAQLIYERRLQKPFANQNELTQLVPLGRALQFVRVGVVGTSYSYSLQSEAELAGSLIKRTLRCVILIDAQDKAQYRTIYWNEMTR